MNLRIDLPEELASRLMALLPEEEWNRFAVSAIAEALAERQRVLDGRDLGPLADPIEEKEPEREATECVAAVEEGSDDANTGSGLPSFEEIASQWEDEQFSRRATERMSEQKPMSDEPTPLPVHRFTLIGGKPPEPDYDDLLENKIAFPGPASFLRPLFMECGGVDVSQCTTTEEIERPYEIRISRGHCGTPQIGYRWQNQTSLDSSADPVAEDITTYNLPGIHMDWSYAWNKMGQMGHGAFRHRSLQVDFDNEDAQSRFEQLWQRVFGTPPVWRI
jgi:hypothetical protein